MSEGGQSDMTQTYRYQKVALLMGNGKTVLVEMKTRNVRILRSASLRNW